MCVWMYLWCWRHNVLVLICGEKNANEHHKPIRVTVSLRFSLDFCINANIISTDFWCFSVDAFFLLTLHSCRFFFLFIKTGSWGWWKCFDLDFNCIFIVCSHSLIVWIFNSAKQHKHTPAEFRKINHFRKQVLSSVLSQRTFASTKYENYSKNGVWTFVVVDGYFSISRVVNFFCWLEFVKKKSFVTQMLRR